MSNKILIVDDSILDTELIKAILYDQELYCASNGLEAMTMLDQIPDIDLMILDINMPKMNGFEVLQVMHDNPKYARVVTLILTNHDELENEIKGLSLGAVDYIRKPLNLEALRKRIDIHAKLKKASKILEENNQILEATVKERTKEITLTRSMSIHALIGLLEIRDIESGNHTLRTQHYIKAICEELAKTEKYRSTLTQDYILEIFETAPLHDIGKVGIPDSILLKPGPLNAEEWTIMKKHTVYGVNALLADSSDYRPSFINTAIDIIGGHHEKFDGSGYPQGLIGEKIPLAGRLMAIADVYDALINKRVYKSAYAHDAATHMIKEGSGTHFDPDLVDAFFACESTILDITHRYRVGE